MIMINYESLSLIGLSCTYYLQRGIYYYELLYLLLHHNYA